MSHRIDGMKGGENQDKVQEGEQEGRITRIKGLDTSSRDCSYEYNGPLRRRSGLTTTCCAKHTFSCLVPAKRVLVAHCPPIPIHRLVVNGL
jgi:hypothetical protein